MATGEQLEALISRYDTALTGIENTTLERVNAALEASYKQLESKLLKVYQQQAGNLSLLPRQRSLLILSEVKDLLSLINTRDAERLQKDFESLLRGSGDLGNSMAADLVQAIANESLQSFASVPLEAVRMQAENGVKRLSRHTEEFRGKASAIVEQGLVQGWGTRKIATAMRGELGVTKGKAEQIARTETISALDDATRANYQRNDILYVQRIGTQDRRICVYCASRNGNVYPVDKAPAAIHPSDRCYNSPFKFEWLELGLIDTAWIEKHRAGAIAELASTGKQPNNGIAPFERLAGAEKPPEPVWRSR